MNKARAIVEKRCTMKCYTESLLWGASNEFMLFLILSFMTSQLLSDIGRILVIVY